MSKTAASNPATPGQALTYTVTVVNRGPDAADAVMLERPAAGGRHVHLLRGQPGHLLRTRGGRQRNRDGGLRDIAVGGSATVTIVVNVTVTYGNLVNTATATSTTPAPDPDNNHDTAVTTVGSGIPMLSP